MSLTDQLIQDLEAWANRPDGQSLERFLAQRVGDAHAAELLTAIDRGQRLFEALRTAREEGLNREAWLARSLRPHLVEDPNSGDFTLPLGEDKVLTGDSPQRVAAVLVEEAVGALWGRGDAAGADAEAWIDGAKEAAQHMPSGAKSVLESFFDTPLGAPVERDVVGVVAGAILHEEAQRSDAAPIDAEAVGSTVDSKLFGAKVAAQVGRGKISESAAQELMADRVAAHLAGFGGRAVREGLPAVGEFVGALIAGRFGQDVSQGAALGRWVGALAGKVVAPFVEAGVQRLAKAGVRWGLNRIAEGIRTGRAILGR